MPTLQDCLKDWDDPDGAMFSMGASLGLWPDDWDTHGLHNKWIFWADNPLGNALFECLEKLATAGILKTDSDSGVVRFCWDPEFSIEAYEQKYKV